MGKTTRKRYSADFKAEAALGASEVESTKRHAKIGQLVVERDFLSKAFGR